MGNCSSTESWDNTANNEQGNKSGDTGGRKNDSDSLPRPKKIYASPILEKEFVPLVHEKSSSEFKFLESSLKENFIFKDLEKGELKSLIKSFENYSVNNGTTIIQDGEIGDYFYVIEKGLVHFFVNGEKVGEGGSGKGFGDLALLYDCPRTATSIAIQDCTLWRVDQITFRQILSNSTITTQREIKSILNKVPFLENLDEDYLTQMAYAATTESFTAGETIIRKGDPGGKFYVLKEGKVAMRDIEAGGKEFDDLIGEEYFGERAILKDEPRAANVVALEDSVVLSLSRETFLTVLGPLKDLIIRSNDARRLKGILAFSKSDVKNCECKIIVSLIKDVKILAGRTIFREGSSSEGAIYIVRSGKVTVTSSTLSTKVLTEGGIFGEASINTKTFVSQGTAVADNDCVLGMLTEKDVYSVIRDRSRLYNPNEPGKQLSSVFTEVIKLKDLDMHRVLGVGSFSKVWLVNRKDVNEQVAYALKIQSKRCLVDQKQVDGVYRELQVMESLNHPFIIKMMNAYQDSQSIMILLDLIQGGELFSLMVKSKEGLGESKSRFYSAGILEALSHMHHRNILYRDLKPENVLIDKDGYPVLVDFGFAKIVLDKTFTLCGTPFYIAPEVIRGRGHDKGCDYWSYAVMLHEMITSVTPFKEHATDQMTLFKAIVYGQAKISRMNPNAMDLIKRVLITRPSLRLGCLAGADLDLKNHQFYSKLDFNDLLEKRIKAPWKPKIKNALDSSRFRHHKIKEIREKPLSKAEKKLFVKFDSICQ